MGVAVFLSALLSFSQSFQDFLVNKPFRHHTAFVLSSGILSRAPHPPETFFSTLRQDLPLRLTLLAVKRIPAAVQAIAGGYGQSCPQYVVR